MFVDFKFSTLKIQLSDYLKPMENSVFQFSVFHSVKPGLSKRVLLVWMGCKFVGTVSAILIYSYTQKVSEVRLVWRHES